MPEPNQFERLAALAAKLGERRLQLEQFRKVIEPLLQGSVDPVEGERLVFEKLNQYLEGAFGLLGKLSAGGETPVLDQIEELLDDLNWDLAAELLPDLEAKGKGQDVLLRETGLDLKGWGIQLADLARVVDGARLEGAPFQDLEDKLSAARSGAASVRSALTDRVYLGLRALRESARSQVQILQDSVRRADSQIAKVKRLARQTDLLIMGTKTTDDDYEYRVLLRAADRFQTPGSNIIQGEQLLGRKDREWMNDLLDQLTRSVNQGLRAAHTRKSNIARTILPADPEAEAPADASMRTLGMLGEFMCRMFIPAQIQKYLREGEGFLCITTNDLALPWELMRFDGLDLCLERSISRMPQGGLVRPLPRRAGRPTKRRMLLIHSDPDGTLTKAAEEVDTIASELKDQLDFVRVGPEEATNARINEVLMSQPFDFIHYAGHACFDKRNPNENGLQLKDSRLTARKIRRLNQGGSLVFLNACESGAVAQDSQPQVVSYLLNNPEAVLGLASAFVYSGAQGCVGSLWPVYDTPAAELAVKFYRHVLAGEPAGEALRMARAEIRQAYPDEITWAAYVLYGDPTFRLTEN